MQHPDGWWHAFHIGGALVIGFALLWFIIAAATAGPIGAP